MGLFTATLPPAPPGYKEREWEREWEGHDGFIDQARDEGPSLRGSSHCVCTAPPPTARQRGGAGRVRASSSRGAGVGSRAGWVGKEGGLGGGPVRTKHADSVRHHIKMYYCWRRLCEGRALLHNCSATQTRPNPRRLPRPSTPSILSPVIRRPSISRVSDREGGSGAWPDRSTSLRQNLMR
ncbi:hypothetical protein O3P69_020824 [Scylla paramamosain]|uniref:Uncharacterized protein n=1 Tax=Scylla paramamosain TaxID=85552 RepID=A0AAW0TR72_SCYPA